MLQHSSGRIVIYILTLIYGSFLGGDSRSTIKVKIEMFVLLPLLAWEARGLKERSGFWSGEHRRKMKLSFDPPGVAGRKYINKGTSAMHWMTSVLELSRSAGTIWNIILQLNITQLCCMQTSPHRPPTQLQRACYARI